MGSPRLTVKASLGFGMVLLVLYVVYHVSVAFCAALSEVVAAAGVFLGSCLAVFIVFCFLAIASLLNSPADYILLLLRLLYIISA
jgi:hypothetical protein